MEFDVIFIVDPKDRVKEPKEENWPRKLGFLFFEMG